MLLSPSEPSHAASSGASSPKPKPGSFQRQLVGFAAIAMLLSGLLIVLALNYLRTQAIETGERLTGSLALVIEEQNTRTFQTVDQAFQLGLNELALLQAAGTLNEASARKVLQQRLPSIPFAPILCVTDANRRLIHDT